MVGNAAIDAAQRLRDILIGAAARKLDARPDQIECVGERFRVSGGQDPGLSFREVAAAALAQGGSITVKGTFTCRRIPGREASRRRGRLDHGLSYAAQVVEVRSTPYRHGPRRQGLGGA